MTHLGIARRDSARSLGCLLATGLVAFSSGADVITVCPDGSCDFTDPAAAVASAVTGDVVEIAAGTYLIGFPGLTLYAQQVTIRGSVDAQGQPATILDGQDATALITFLHIEPTVTIENLVIANGRSDFGGGMFMQNSDPVFVNCLIEANTANFHGGGMWLAGDSNPTFIECELSGNRSQYSGGIGGAAHVSQGSITLIDCLVADNMVMGQGGGLSMSSSGTAILQSTRVCGNLAPNDAQIRGGWSDAGGACVSDNCGECPDAPPCPADVNGDGLVNGVDLGEVLAAWGSCKQGCAADIDGSGAVNGADLAIVLSAWGTCG